MTPSPSPSSPADATPPVRPPLGLRERKKARTRAAIQEHALRLFREQGYAETTVEQIAEAAEISPSTFFRYFPTKGEAVLAEFIDARIFELLIEAPAELDLIGAFRHALNAAFAEMSDDQIALEMERNQLIASVPELQRGLIEEIVRPIRLLAEAFALRLGLPSDDPSVLAYAGAVVGAMLAVAGPTEHGLPGEVGEDYRNRLVPALDLVEQTLVRRS
jgi:AcrR family transcriptional regulator